MENKFKIKELKLVPTTGSSLKQEWSLLRGGPIISYYENIRTPAITMSLTFVDADGVISNEGITGGEYIQMEIDFKELGIFKIDASQHRMMVNSIGNVNTKSSRQTATLEAISVESIVNETVRVSKKFDATIDQTVRRLLVSEEKGVKTSKRLDSESVANKYSFVGNQKRPIDIIQWLCPKASASGTSFGFLFFETLDGYVFKSIDTLFNQPVSQTYTKSEIASSSDFRILDDQVNKNTDIGLSMRMGMYANKTLYMNMKDASREVVDFKITELGLQNAPKAPLNLDTKPTRLMFRMLDVGALQKDAKLSEIQKPQDLAKYQNRSYARNNLIFSQSLNIMVPCNPNLRAGQTVEIKLPLPTSDQKTKRYGDGKKDISGKYLISELKHEIGNNKAYTQLSLIRNTFTA
jgi:hypothetical protein